MSRTLYALGWPARSAILGPLWLYRRLVGPSLGARCRFHPSCSAYAEEAVHTHGALRGGALALWRVLRCSPLSAGGIDPVPGPRHARSASDAVIHTREAAA